MKKRICWVTATYFLQVDLPILSTLNKHYHIDWYVWGKSISETGEIAKKYALENGITINFIESSYVFFNPKMYFFCKKAIQLLQQKKYDVYYFNISTFPWLLGCIKNTLPADKVIIAMHHGKIHSGMRFKLVYRPFLRYLNRQPFILQYFSNIQAEAFNGNDIGKRYIIPLALNDFGAPDTVLNDKKVVFTAFGNIIQSKNIPLLIEAGNKLWEELGGRFKIKIVGKGGCWQSSCAPLIKHPEAFDIDIRRVPEVEIPNLFASSHYIVFPYKAVTQSGPLRIAYGYNVPIIASDLDGFKESVEDGVTGLLFKSDDVNSLVDVMKIAILNHSTQYNNLKLSQYKYIQEKLTTASVCSKYIEMLDNALSK